MILPPDNRKFNGAAIVKLCSAQLFKTQTVTRLGLFLLSLTQFVRLIIYEHLDVSSAFDFPKWISFTCCQMDDAMLDFEQEKSPKDMNCYRLSDCK